jgi:hypothetical protein
MRNLYTALALLFVVQITNAQISPAYKEMRDREMQSQQTMFRGDMPTNEVINGLDYDQVYARLELRLNPDTSISTGKYVWGAITTYFITGKTNFNRINFDMASALTCDSVYYHGVKLAAGNITEQVDTLRITLPNIAAIGTLDSIKVFYKGTPPTVTTWTTTGFVRGGTTNSTSYIHTLSEPYSAYTWWPSKSRISYDKFDSVDIIVSTPSVFKVAANGKRIAEPVSGSNRLTTWKHRYPISTYQICIGVARYVQYPTTPTLVNIGGTNMELYNLLWSNATGSSVALDRTAEMLTVMSNKFSDYPFKNEKYGHYTFGFSGGMEHNTFSGMGSGTYNSSADWDVIAHELGHQWWGASVTCGSWRDIWVNESFARYSEVVYLEGKTDGSLTVTPTQHRLTFKDDALPANAEKIYRADTSTMSAIFSPSVYIYERGAMFVSMLRKTLGDTKFFQALQNYQTDPTLRYSNAYTNDVQRHMEAVSGLDLSGMFNDWMYSKGHASYSTARWNNVGNQVILMLPQTAVSADSAHFDMPIVLRFKRTSPTLDTTIVLFDKSRNLYRVNNGVLSSPSGGSLIQIALSFTPTSVEFDPFAETLAEPNIVTSAGPTYTIPLITKDAGLALLATNVVNFAAQKEGKNARLDWNVEQSSDYSSFEIERSTNGTVFEKIGAQLSSQNNGVRNFNFIDHNIPAGIIYYRIKIIEKNGASFYTRIASVNNKLTESFVVTPNPASDHIMISHGASSVITANIKLVDNIGKTVKVLTKQSIAAGNKLRIPLQEFAAGTYYVEIESDQYFKVVKKIAVIK